MSGLSKIISDVHDVPNPSEAIDILRKGVRGLRTREVIGSLFDEYLYALALEHQDHPKGYQQPIVLNVWRVGNNTIGVTYSPKHLKISYNGETLKDFTDERVIKSYPALSKAVVAEAYRSDLPF